MEESHRGLLEKDPKQSTNDLDDDVKKLKRRIAERLEVYEDKIRPRRFIIKSSTSKFLN